MIIFYSKKTNKIFGVIEGRVHDNPNLGITSSDVSPEDTGKYIVPFKPKTRIIDVPVKKFFLVNKKTKEVEERIVGVKKQEVPDGLEPDVSFSDLILKFESGEENIYSYKIIFDKNDVVTGF
ncbi:MAG: hypothetical protein PHO75_02195, partial [Candidatus Shapirobacteria bacterium]|nr:hypothetical protein [Candidatus Shapirobacteria bacterium]